MPRTRERDKQEKSVEFGKRNKSGSNMGSLQYRITGNCNEEDHGKDLISKMLDGVSIFSKYLFVHVHTCVCICMFEFRLGSSVMEPD